MDLVGQTATPLTGVACVREGFRLQLAFNFPLWSEVKRWRSEADVVAETMLL